MANVEDERLSGEENLTLEELRSKLAQMNLPISGARSVLVARLNRACKPGRSTPKDSKRGEEPTNQRDLRSKQRAERSQQGEEDLEKLRTKELRARLVSLGLKVTGRKSELRARLQAALEGNDVSSEEESSDESEGEDDKQGAREYRRGTRAVYQDRDEYHQKVCVGSMLSLKDVEGSLEKFSGDDLLSVNQWVEDFEEMAEVWGWSDAHMVAYAKKLLAGSAQAFVRQERCAKSWAKLKKALRNEFENVVSDQQIHRELSHRKKKADESLQQYMYHMCGIAKQGRVDTQSLIDYIIQGIPDEVANKTVLYGARNIEQLKERFRRYEAIKRDMEMRTKFEESKSSRVKPVAKLSETERNKEPGRSGDARKARCYNCGDAEHVCAECPSKLRGPKCFKCREYGHIASKCDNLGESSKKIYSVFRSLQTRRGKDVKIENFELSALIDTDSELTLMRADQHVKIGAPILSRQIVGFRGVGFGRNFTLGKFSTNIITDNESYDITTHVISDTLMPHSLIIGTDFLDTVELNIKEGNASIRKVEEKDCNRLPEVFKVDIEIQQDEVIDQSQSDFANPIVVEKRNGSLHVPIEKNSRECTAVVVPTSACLEGTVVMSKILLDKSVARNITAVASSGNDTDGCDEVFVGYTEYRANCRNEQTSSSSNSKKRMKSENETATEKFEVVRRRAINPTSCRRRAFNKRRKKATTYKMGDLVAIKRTQGGPGLKLHSKFLGPYHVVKVLRNDRYIVQREGEHEGPRTTSTAADHMKWWNADDSDVIARGDDEHI
ncbi:uncharacterized protein [Bombus flavifrons]|uniref:uncharacterized protein n=1 Tax=Bombus flavifrons TaxID=103934 RepID=UPI0037045C07